MRMCRCPSNVCRLAYVVPSFRHPPTHAQYMYMYVYVRIVHMSVRHLFGCMQSIYICACIMP